MIRHKAFDSMLSTRAALWRHQHLRCVLHIGTGKVCSFRQHPGWEKDMLEMIKKKKILEAALLREEKKISVEICSLGKTEKKMNVLFYEEGDSCVIKGLGTVMQMIELLVGDTEV